MERLLNLVTVLSLALIAAVLFSLRRAHIRVEYSVSWFVAGVALFILSRSHTLLDRLAAFLGFEQPPLALLALVLLVFSLVVYRLSIIISDLKDANIALSQRVAILEYRINSIHEAKEATGAR
jgi:hypothetical protein